MSPQQVFTLPSVLSLEHFTPLLEALRNSEVEDDGFDSVLSIARDARLRDARVFFIGNGGSAAIASHMAIDWMNKGKFAAISFNDGAALTCLSNDYGYPQVFERQIVRHAREGDMLFAISSSGASINITRVANLLRPSLRVVTLSGFSPDNPLRKAGAVNFYVPSKSYGVVETAHLAILHSILDKLTV